MFLKQILNIDDIDFNLYASQQFATVSFDRKEDADIVNITVLKDGKVSTFKGNNQYNISPRRNSSCVYIRQEYGSKIIKVCTWQHKGITDVKAYKVSREEYNYLFVEEKKNLKPKSSKTKTVNDFDTEEEYFNYFHKKFKPQ